MRRSAPLRRTAWRRKPPKRKVRAVRPGVTPGMPRDWGRRCRIVRTRDRELCRVCGAQAQGARGAVDHILPRRLAGRFHSALDNLALLCAIGEFPCHARKTVSVEPALYHGDLVAFNRWLGQLSETGPIPTPHARARAYVRLRRLLDAPTP